MSSTYGFSVRSWDKRSKPVKSDTAKRESKFTEVNELASLPSDRFIWIHVNPDRPIHMETSCIGFGRILLGVLDAVDSLVLLEVRLGFHAAGEMEV